MSDTALAQVFTAEGHTSEDNTERTVRTIVYLPEFRLFPNGTLLYSFDDETFYALVCEGFGGSETSHTLVFLDPHHKVEGQIVRTDNVVTYNDCRYVLQHGPFSPTNIVQVPQTRRVDLFGVTKNGIMVHLNTDEYRQPDQEPYESYRLYAGRGTLKHHEINDVDPLKSMACVSKPPASFGSPSRLPTECRKTRVAFRYGTARS